MYQLLDVSKGFLEASGIKENDVLADFTMGNGYDTEYLCTKVPKGKVYAFDIQLQAVENTKKRLAEAGFDNAVIIHDSHAKVLKYIKEPIKAGMFNLGYLPGGDKSIHTMRESTMPAINGAVSLLQKGGILVINVYPGHEEGSLEGQMLLEELAKLSRFEYCVTHLRIINSPDAPFIIAVERYNK